MNPDEHSQLEKNKIQNYAALVVVSSDDLKISHLSQNISEFFKLNEKLEDLIGKKLNAVFGYELVEKIQQRCSHVVQYEGLDIHIYQVEKDHLFLEFSWLEDVIEPANDRFHDYFFSLKNADNVNELGKIACQAVKEISGMDRVILYHFSHQDSNGLVLAEEGDTHNHSSKDLFRAVGSIYIFDTEAQTTEIYPPLEPPCESRIRAITAKYLEPFKSQQTRTSFSIPVKVKDKLWGLLQCHAAQHLYVPHHSRMMCQIVAEVLAFGAPLMEQKIT